MSEQVADAATPKPDEVTSTPTQKQPHHPKPKGLQLPKDSTDWIRTCGWLLCLFYIAGAFCSAFKQTGKAPFPAALGDGLLEFAWLAGCGAFLLWWSGSCIRSTLRLMTFWIRVPVIAGLFLVVPVTGFLLARMLSFLIL